MFTAQRHKNVNILLPYVLLFFNILHSDAPVFTKKTEGMSSLFVLAISQESLHVLQANLIFPFIDMHNNRQMFLVFFA